VLDKGIWILLGDEAGIIQTGFGIPENPEAQDMVILMKKAESHDPVYTSGPYH
jgi:hypothetical protein